MSHETTDLREKLNKLIIELDRLDITLDSPVSSMTLGEYEQEREKLLDGFTQAIAATLGSLEIVRCSDCIYLDTTRGSLVPRAGICTATCTRLSTQIPWQNIDSGFCAWGKQVEQ